MMKASTLCSSSVGGEGSLHCSFLSSAANWGFFLPLTWADPPGTSRTPNCVSTCLQSTEAVIYLFSFYQRIGSCGCICIYMHACDHMPICVYTYVCFHSYIHIHTCTYTKHTPVLLLERSLCSFPVLAPSIF